MSTTNKTGLRILSLVVTSTLAFSNSATAQNPSSNDTDQSARIERDFVCSDFASADERDSLIQSASSACGSVDAPFYLGGNWSDVAGKFCFICLTPAQLQEEANANELEALASALTDPEEQSKVRAILPQGNFPAPVASAAPSRTPTYLISTRLKVCATRNESVVIPQHQDQNTGEIIREKKTTRAVYRWIDSVDGKLPQGWKTAAPKFCAKARESIIPKIPKVAADIFNGLNNAKRALENR
jgi:hypothetical protein